MWRSISDGKLGGMEDQHRTTIKIWKDHWLPTSSTFKVQSPVAILDGEATLRELFTVDQKQWSGELIQWLFYEDEIKAILQLPISASGRLDRVIWGLTTNGELSMKNAYAISFNLKSNTKREGSKKAGQSYKQMWHLWYQARLKTFYGKRYSTQPQLIITFQRRKQ